MSFRQQFAKIARFFRRRSAAEHELAEEMRAHVDLETHENIAAGMPPEEARRAAMLKFGNATLAAEDSRAAWRFVRVDSLLKDFRYGARMLRKNPGFSSVALLTLALGIGVNTAIFSVVDATLLSVIPYPHPETIMAPGEHSETFGDISLDWPDLMDWRQQNHVFQYLAAYHFHLYNLTGAGEPVQLHALEASTDFYRITETTPEIGRLYTDAEDKPGASPVLLLTHNLWRNRFGEDPGVLGKPLNLNGKPYTIIGVMPANFWTREPADIFVPIGPVSDNPDWQDRGEHPVLRGMGRLKPGVTIAQARADLAVIGRRLEQQYPRTNSGVTATVRVLRDGVTSDIQPTLFVLLGAAGFVLLTACANVANLLLARSSARQREMAIRAALGAARGRLFQQTLIESILLGLAGGGLGLLLAMAGIRPLLRLAPLDIHGLENTHVNPVVLGCIAAISILSAILFGTVPALQGSRPAVAETLKQASRSVAGSRSRVQSAVLVAEVAFALVLATGAGLMIRSILRVRAAPLGFQPDRVLTFGLRLPEGKYRNAAADLQFFQQAIQRIETVPGVRAAATVRCLPMAGGCWASGYVLGDRPIPRQADLPAFDTNVVTVDYFKVLAIPLLKGRYFSAQDDTNSPPVIIINETLARRMWPNGDPLGKTIKQGQPQDSAPYRQVVGIVADVKRDGPDAAQNPEVFMPLAQKIGSGSTFVVRTEQDPMSAANAIAVQIHALDKDLPLVDVQPITQYVGETLARRKFSTLLLGLFGALALALAAIGIYGVMAYSVSLRMQEMGIRTALGAQRRDLLRLVVGRGLWLTSFGVAAGLAGSFGITRFMESLLFGVRATDPFTFFNAAILLGAVAAVASYIPARRAARVDPIVALRHE